MGFLEWFLMGFGSAVGEIEWGIRDVPLSLLWIYSATQDPLSSLLKHISHSFGGVNSVNSGSRSDWELMESGFFYNHEYLL